MISSELLKILACSVCKTDVEHVVDKIVCVKCNRKYLIKDGIPIMLVSEAGVDE
ncbi:MAG: Trm112 family protein [Candidatus Omnitrophota bacterium]|nr:Trm112 family protein [Candidatus Omnitrophota bacterium]